MPFIAPNDFDKIQVPEIDAEHERLVELINELYEAMNSKRGKEVLGRGLRDLIEFTRLHFSHEEELMTAHEYPDSARHKAEHERLLAHVVDLDRRFRSGDVLLSFAILLELKSWATKHIMHSDMPLGEFLNRINR